MCCVCASGFNSYGEESQDLITASTRADDIHSVLGIWPAFSMFNHSCLPNAVYYTIRDRMVVRAIAAVAAGEELCINYLGRVNLSPVQLRQDHLEEGYGFTCSCIR